MRTFRLVMIAAVLACGTSVMAGDIAPSGTLRAVYLGTNPAQAMRDPATGEVRGPAYDLARELARRNNVPLEFKPIASPPAVIEAVKNGETDIGFVAYEATRLGTVEFSQTYMLVRQSFLVLDGSPIKAIADIDRAGQKIAGTLNDFDYAVHEAHSQAGYDRGAGEQSGRIEPGADRAHNRRARRKPPAPDHALDGDTRHEAVAGRLIQRAAEYRRAEGPAGAARGG
jgi:ABC-type amino acid transport substrate-binding protein